MKVVVEMEDIIFGFVQKHRSFSVGEMEDEAVMMTKELMLVKK